jgi:predicted methyltransferase
MRTLVATLASTLLLIACSKPGSPGGESPAAAPPAATPPATTMAPPGAPTAASSEAIASALAAPGRLPSDREQDASRKPAEVLAFFGVKPGMTVLDLFSGGGYYTEILSGIVGPEGRVYAHNNTPYLSFSKKDIDARYADPSRLPNVERILAENDAIELPENTFDFVLMSMVYHDIYLVDEENGWSRIDGPKMLAEIHASMKPGTVLGVIDHVAAPGSPPETGGTLHRIDPDLLKRDITAAGFVFDAESDVLRNPADDHTKPVFDESIRGHTDRVVYRFRRP